MKTRIQTAVMIFLSGTMLACLSATGDSQVKVASTPAASKLEGTTWNPTELAGASTRDLDPQRKAYLQFQAGGRVAAWDGCNGMGGGYRLDGDRVSFGPLGGTEKGCSPPGLGEPFRGALINASRLVVAGDRLELFDATGARLAVFVAGHPTTKPKQ